MGSWCTNLSNYMGGWCLRKLNSMGGWVKKSAVFPPQNKSFCKTNHQKEILGKRHKYPEILLSRANVVRRFEP